jgi:excisionase family DNA binding protein
MRIMLTVSEAATLAGKNPETIRRWIRSGKLRASKFGTQHMVDEIALDELINGIRAVNVPEWLAGPSPVTGWTADDIVRMVRRERDER